MFWNKQDIIPMLLTVHTSGSLEVSAELWLTRLNTWLVIIGQRIQQCHRSLPLASINTCYDIIGRRTPRTCVSSPENALIVASYIISIFWGIFTLSRREALGGEPKLLLNISCFGPLSFILSSDDKASLYIKSSDKPGVSAPLSYNEKSLPEEKEQQCRVTCKKRHVGLSSMSGSIYNCSSNKGPLQLYQKTTMK